ncbi:SusC/RagA family TonB-linked outer membrane protein [Prevotella cerevisiae]|uniref:SusC/RagA family TonB-linked outer membrane protein n=1 Tax=Segatella cerevisiae TaxID=2053716 RepID=A0ABT1BYY5_9BACT|nr:SusC/RagA family TonB-linked outer membrane protein [Segatella cerevisiae]MCO6026292.1 SusC/RagA family TonB-linked outer membrane protein [Segatella cerevisiae]
MGKRLMMFLACMFLFVGMAMAQSQVTGVVVSSSDGQPIVGASVMITGTKLGTVTDADGRFTLSAPSGSRLRISYLGMQQKEVKTAPYMKITLQNDNKTLNEVVVTAFGITRQKRSLGYATTEIDSKDLTSVNEGNLNNALVGKVAGARFIGGSGAKFDEGTIVLRGVTSITSPSGTAPIYVVDGVISSPSSVDMNDVASVNVLKGPAATALYGVRGGNGAVIIVTKGGSVGRESQSVNIGHTIEWTSAYNHVDFQKEYGGGYLGSDGLETYHWEDGDPENYKQFDGRKYYDYADDSSWGPKFDGSLYMTAASWDSTSPYFGKEDTWSNHFNIKDLFNTGVTNTTNASFDKSGKDYSVHVGLGTSSIGGVDPNSDAQRRFANAKLIFNPMKNLKVDFSYKYTYRKNHNAAAEGYSSNNPYADLLQWGNTNVDLKEYKDYQRPDGTFRTWNITSPTDFTPAFHDSPYATYNEINDANTRQYHTISADLEYSLPFNIKIGWKTTADIHEYIETYDNPALTGVIASHKQWQEQSSDIYNQARITWNDVFVDGKLNMNAAFFLENRYYHYEGVNAFTQDGLLIPGLYNTGNSAGTAHGDDAGATYDYFGNYTGTQKLKTQSIFGTYSAGWADTYYIELSLRNDWNSTLPVNNNSYLYGGASVSAIASNWFHHGNWLNYWKLRGSLAQVGSALSPYELSNVYNFGTRYGSTATLVNSAVLIDNDIKPSITTSYEVGTEFSLFNNRLWGDINYYRRDTKNQIIKVSTSASSGYSSRLTNAGLIRNEGFEISLGGSPIKTKDWEWRVDGNVAHNSNKLVRLTSGMNRYTLESFGFYAQLYSYAEVGKPIGALYTSRNWEYNEDGKIVMTANGDGTYTPQIDSNTERYLGNIQPKVTGGFSTSLRWKDLTVRASLDFRFGGKIASITNMWLEGSGMASNTAGLNNKGGELRGALSDNGGVAIDGVVKNSDGSYTDVTAYMDAMEYFMNYKSTLWEPYVYNASYIKLRELSLAYSLPSNWLEKLHIGLTAASVSFIASNPFLIWSDCPNIDPSETNGSAFEEGQAVSTRSFGLSVNLTF